MDLLHANDQQGQYPPSFYAASAPALPRQPIAQGDLSCDIAIVGAGFTGLNAALHLAIAGFDVILCDAQRIGFGASGRNGGQLGTGQRRDQDALEQMVGLEDAKSLWQVGLDAVAHVRGLIDQIDGAEVYDGIIHAAHRARYVGEEHDYAEKMARDYGYDKMTPLSRDQLREKVDSPAYYGGVLDMGGGHIHPLRYALGLGQLALDAGVRIFENTKITQVNKGAKPSLKTDQAQIHAKHIVLACNGYLGGLEPKVASRVMPINNYIVATERLPKELQAKLIADNHAVADTKFVVNYFRMLDDRMLFGGTESYGYRFPSDIARAVRKPMAQIYPQLRDVKIDYAWGGTLAITMNRMPYFADLGGGVINASGFSGYGVAMGSMGGKIVGQMLQGQHERFDLMSRVPTTRFPGGAHLRSPLLVLAMLWYSLRDQF